MSDLEDTPSHPTANDHLERLRHALYEPPGEPAWRMICAALDAIDEPGTLAVALDMTQDTLRRTPEPWRQPAQIVPASWLAALTDGGRDPRLALLDALGIERALFALIPPGQFTMGSPKGEAGRSHNEDQVEVVLSRGFAVGVFPVTQGLWTQMMGENPSRFQGGDPQQASLRPVEQVSWFEAVAFCNVMSARWGLEPFYRRSDGQHYGPEEAQAEIIPEIEGWEGSGWRLPTEAEWEYACRAGTTEATYVGDLKILGERDAPLLDEIGWYGGNSGVDYEGGVDSSRWSGMQKEARMSGTHPVGLKKANSFGLHDMLGNVAQWCWDWHGAYPIGAKADPCADPSGLRAGSYRVVRGGRWRSSARGVRAASRGYDDPRRRVEEVGLRLVRSASPR